MHGIVRPTDRFGPDRSRKMPTHRGWATAARWSIAATSRGSNHPTGHPHVSYTELDFRLLSNIAGNRIAAGAGLPKAERGLGNEPRRIASTGFAMDFPSISIRTRDARIVTVP